MAIRFGMTVNEMIRQLTNGFRSVKFNKKQFKDLKT